MNSFGKAIATIALVVSGAAGMTLSAQAATAQHEPDYYNMQETSAAARQNSEWRSHMPADREWRALVRHEDRSIDLDATAPQRGYGF